MSAPAPRPTLAAQLEHLAGYAREAADAARTHGRIREARHLQHLAARIGPVAEAIAQLERERDTWRGERLPLAMLASDTPLFANPLRVWGAQQIRDAILTEAGMRPVSPAGGAS